MMNTSFPLVGLMNIVLALTPLLAVMTAIGTGALVAV
jgi:energy-converting hydrogenase Eha subunit E